METLPSLNAQLLRYYLLLTLSQPLLTVTVNHIKWIYVLLSEKNNFLNNLDQIWIKRNNGDVPREIAWYRSRIQKCRNTKGLVEKKNECNQRVIAKKEKQSCIVSIEL